jgi:hypothetical protein
MFTLACFDGGIYGKNQLSNIEAYNRSDISDIRIADLNCIPEKDGYGPPKSNGIDKK